MYRALQLHVPTLTLPLLAAQASCTGLRALDIACPGGYAQQGIPLFQVRPGGFDLGSPYASAHVHVSAAQQLPLVAVVS